jgi:hypothetical protein
MFCAYNWCALPEDDPKRDEIYWSCNILIVKLYLYLVDFVAYSYQSLRYNVDKKGRGIRKKEECGLSSTSYKD